MKYQNLVYKIILITIIFDLLISCRGIKPSIVYVNKDSIITNTETVIRDTIIKVPGDTIRFQIPCNKDTVFIYKSKSSSSMVQVHKGIITVQNNCDEKDLIIKNLSSKLHEYELHKTDSVKTEIRIVKHTPVVYKVFTWGFWLLLTAGATLYFTNNNIWVLIATSLAGIFTKKK